MYESREQQRAAIVPFFREGLARGERCLYIADDRTVDEVKAYLADAGIDIEDATERGAFTIATKRNTYFKDGAFDPVAMIDLLGETVEDTIKRGFSGLRGSGEMTWALGDAQGCDRAIEYEALLNDFFPGKPFVALCQYNATRFAPGILLDVLRTHHYAVLGNEVCPNLYFEPREMVLGESSDAAKLAWRTAQLKRARDAVDALEYAIRARESFFAVAGHELRTPLTVLRLRLEQTARDLARGENASAERATETALAQVDHLSTLATRFADVTQLASGHLALNRSRVDLSRLIRDLVRKHQTAAGKAECPLLLDVQDRVVGVWDELRVDQLVGTLLSNALKFGRGKPVRVRLHATADNAVITVQDNGIGIAPADQRRIFGPFQRAVSENHYSGFGVGLWMVQQIAEAHGGMVLLRSAPQQGATFTITLPRSLPS